MMSNGTHRFPLEVDVDSRHSIMPCLFGVVDTVLCHIAFMLERFTRHFNESSVLDDLHCA